MPRTSPRRLVASVANSLVAVWSALHRVRTRFCRGAELSPKREPARPHVQQHRWAHVPAHDLTLAGLLGVAVLASAGVSKAQVTWYVNASAIPPGNGSPAAPFPTIQAAIDAPTTLSGHQVLVASASYHEAINYHGKAIRIQGAGASSTTIDVAGLGTTAVRMVSGEGPGVTLAGFTIRGASVSGGAGGVWCNNSSPTLEDLVITSNSCSGNGAGLEAGGCPSIMIRRCLAFGNTANVDGGGLNIRQCSLVTVEDSVVRDNQSSSWGGGIYLSEDPNVTLTRVTVVNNSSSYGGAFILQLGCNVVWEHCTIANNTAYGLGGGFFLFHGNVVPNNQGVLHNSIVWNNTPDEVNVYWGPGSISASYTDFRGGTAGAGNLNVDPQFVNPANRDYSLAPLSPCINAGDPSSPVDPDGSRTDMGTQVLPTPVAIYASRVSVSSSGVQGNDNSRAAAVSDDGHFVAFKSVATTLVPSDTNGFGDVFMRDLQNTLTEIVSVSSSGAMGNGESYAPSTSRDGRYVAFFTAANNLIAADTNGKLDVLLRDRLTGTTTLVSKSNISTVGNNDSDYCSISLDGNLVAFRSAASNLVTGDTNSKLDIFVRNVALASMTLASVATGGALANGNSQEPIVAGNGRYVAFSSDATNLVAGDTNGVRDVFVRDMLMGTTVRVSQSTAGVQGNQLSDLPTISADGRWVAFQSNATNLVAGDVNGVSDIFLHDPQTGTTTMLTQGNGASSEAVLSSDGQVLVFTSSASNLVSGDTNQRDDIFAMNPFTGFVSLASVNANGVQGNDHSREACVSAGGQVIAYRSDASNLVAGDTNGVGDVFANVPLQAFFLDADGDNYGDPGVKVVTAIAPPSYVSNALDCNDSDPSVHPGAAELCNGVDDNCNGVIDEGFMNTYCTAGTTTHLCQPSIAGEGTPSSISSSGFDIVVHSVEGQRNGLIFYGFFPTATPWAVGSLSYNCVASPVQRTAIISSGGAAGQCNGELRLAFNAWLQAHPTGLGYPFVQGQVFYAQGWFRDPAAPKGTNLSNGLRFTLCN